MVAFFNYFRNCSCSLLFSSKRKRPAQDLYESEVFIEPYRHDLGHTFFFFGYKSTDSPKLSEGGLGRGGGLKVKNHKFGTYF